MDLQTWGKFRDWCHPCLQAATQFVEQILITTKQSGERRTTSSAIPLSIASDSAGKCPLCNLLRATITSQLLDSKRLDVRLCLEVTEPYFVYIEDAGGKGKQNLFRAPRGILTLASEPETPIGGIIPGRRISMPGSEVIGATVRRWTKECDTNHAKCQQLRDSSLPSLPTRVLDVRGTPFLFISNGLRDRYVALSHCWGNQQLDMTTKDNYESFRRGIDLQSLSKTVRDSIKVLQWLGIRYLWVDSLCIIQDDNNDWSREAMQMGDIYEKAYCTIAASAATDGSVGCFAQNIQDDYVVPILSSVGSADQVYLSKLRRPERKGFDAGPLSPRAWIMQERLLSPRIIHFADDQVYWECPEYTVSETGWKPQPTDFCTLRDWLYKGVLAGTEGPMVTNICREPVESSKEAWFLNFWTKFIEVYSNKCLSIATDKLLALQGIASRIEKTTSLKYYAGSFFETSVPSAARSLIWRRADSFLHRNSLNLPSWSWASLDGVIKFHQEGRLERMQESGVQLRSPHGSPLEQVSQIQEAPTLAAPCLTMYGPVIAAYRPGRSPSRIGCCGSHIFNVPEPRFMIEWESRRGERRGERKAGPLHIRHCNVGGSVISASYNMLCFDVEDCQPQEFFITPLFKTAEALRYYLVLEKLAKQQRTRYGGGDTYRRIGLAMMVHERDDKFPPSNIFSLV